DSRAREVSAARRTDDALSRLRRHGAHHPSRLRDRALAEHPCSMKHRFVRGAALAVIAGAAALARAHAMILASTRVDPLPIAARAIGPVVRDAAEPELRRVEGAYVRKRGGIVEVSLSGTPEQIGTAHATLLRDEMIANEEQLQRELARIVPFVPVRV